MLKEMNIAFKTDLTKGRPWHQCTVVHFLNFSSENMSCPIFISRRYKANLTQDKNTKGLCALRYVVPTIIGLSVCVQHMLIEQWEIQNMVYLVTLVLFIVKPVIFI